jgi:hypothetical protein
MDSNPISRILLLVYFDPDREYLSLVRSGVTRIYIHFDLKQHSTQEI